MFLNVLEKPRSYFNLYKKYPYDVILMRLQGIEWAVKYVKQKLNVPLILEINSPIDYEVGRLHGRGKLKLYSSFEKSLWNTADKIIVVSTPLREYLINQGVAPNIITVNPNGADINAFNPKVNGNSKREKLGLENNFIITFSGTPMPWHDVEILISALKELPKNVILMIIGSSPNINQLKTTRR